MYFRGINLHNRINVIKSNEFLIFKGTQYYMNLEFYLIALHKFMPFLLKLKWGTRWCSLFRHWATSRSSRVRFPIVSLALGSIQPLTYMSIRNISWVGKDGRCVGLKPYHLHMPTVLNSGSLNLLGPSGLVQACTGIALPLPLPFPCAVNASSCGNQIHGFP
jgi:hypothetical protein